MLPPWGREESDTTEHHRCEPGAWRSRSGREEGPTFKCTSVNRRAAPARLTLDAGSCLVFPEQGVTDSRPVTQGPPLSFQAEVLS